MRRAHQLRTAELYRWDAHRIMGRRFMLSENDIVTIAAYCKDKLDLANATLNDEYYYQSLPLCVIDAVFSMGARYSSTENTVRRVCEYFGLKLYSRERLPISEQLSVSEFISLYDRFSIEEMADRIYQNRQRTSTRNGILKAEAVLLFVKALRQFEVDYYQDMSKVEGKVEFETKVAEIPGQRSGISTRYFYMLAGSDDYIKPDRMITNFIGSVIQRKLSLVEIHEAIIRTHRILAKEFPQLTPRVLDHQIWLYQREKN